MIQARLNQISVSPEMLKIIEDASSQLEGSSQPTKKKISAAFTDPLTRTEMSHFQERLIEIKQKIDVTLHPRVDWVIDNVLNSLRSRSDAVNDEIKTVRQIGHLYHSNIDKAIDAIRHKAEEMNVVVPNTVLASVRLHLKKQYAKKFNETKELIEKSAAEGNAGAVSGLLYHMKWCGAQIGRTVPHTWEKNMRAMVVPQMA